MPKPPLSMKPTGWFQVAWSDEIAVGEVRRMKYFDRDMVAWRTESGTISAPTIQRQPATIEGVIRDGDTVLLLGSADGQGADATSEADDQAWAWIMGSADGGRTWDPAQSWTGSDGSCVGPAVQHATTVVMHGCRRWQIEDGDAATPAFWVATLAQP